MGKLRFLAALWAAKLSIPVLRITKHNGTNFPGELALKLCPDFLKYVAKPGYIVTVTGTNGKTTVCNLVCDILEKNGRKVLNNRAGSNINSGIATAMLTGVSVFNRAKFSAAVLEVDERSSKRIYPYVHPDLTLITNLFRDSIMRNAHPGYIADFLTQSSPADTRLVLNADDLISARVAPDNERVYFGIGPMETDVTECINRTNDMQICPRCHGVLKYEYLRYHHIGKACCPDCGFAAPESTYFASNVDFHAGQLVFREGEEQRSYSLLSDSIFNAYNLTAAVALLREMGLTHDEIAAAMADTRLVASRYKEEVIGSNKLITHMSKEKNALACSRAFDYVSGQPGEKEILLLVNCIGDEKHWSENICWLYDCDVEFLANPSIRCVVVTGKRAWDYKQRLMLAGVPEEKIRLDENPFSAAALLDYAPGTSIYVLHGVDSLNLANRVRAVVADTLEKGAG